MPKTVPVTINEDDIEPDPVNVDRGDKINWTNNTSVTLVLGLPRIFSPPQDPEIDPGQTSRDFTVNANATVGDHGYSIATSSAVPRNGTIDVH